MADGPHALVAEAVGGHSDEAVARGDPPTALVVRGVRPGIVFAYVVPEVVVASLDARAGVCPDGEDDALARHRPNRFRSRRTVLIMCLFHGSKITTTSTTSVTWTRLGEHPSSTSDWLGTQESDELPSLVGFEHAERFYF